MFRKHAFAILLALLVGTIYAAPDVYHAFTPGYQGIFMADSGDADYYLSVINKSYDSAGTVQDPFHYEYQNTGNTVQYFLIEYALGKTGALLHLRIDRLAITAEFLFPALLTLLLYGFAYRLSRSRPTAFAVSGAMMVGTELVHPNGLSNLFNTFLFNGNFSEFLLYSRPVNPQVSSIFFFATLFALYTLLLNPRSKWAIIATGLSVGVLAYIYPYFWIFAVVAAGVVALYALATRRWPLFVSMCLAGVVTALTMAPFLLANLPTLLNGGATQLTQAIPTHRIIIEKVVLAPLFIYALVYLWAWWSLGKGKLGKWADIFAQKYLFVLLLLITGVIVSNQQVITGKMFYQQHFHFFTNIPLFVLSSTLLLMEILRFVPKVWRNLAAGGLVIVCAWFALGVQVASYRSHSQESARYQALAPVFAYLNNQAPEQVVFTDYYLSTRLPMYTQNFTYGGAYDTAFAVPQEQLMHDYFVTLAIRGVTVENIRTYLDTHRNEVGSILFIGTYWRDLCGSYGCFPDSVLDTMVPQYRTFMSKPLLSQIKTHKIDYLLWDTKKEPGWKLNGLVKNPPVFESGDFKLYSIQ